MSVYLQLAREAVAIGSKVLPKTEQVAATGKVFDMSGVASSAYQAGHSKFALNVIREVARDLGIKLPQTAETSLNTAKEFAGRGLPQTVKEPVISAGHSIEVTPIGEIIKGNIRNAEPLAAAKTAATRAEAVLPKAVDTVEAGNKPPLVDLVREIVKGAKYDGAAITKQNGTTTVNFESGAWKGAQAVADDSHILTEVNGRVVQHSLKPIDGFEKMSNRFVNG